MTEFRRLTKTGVPRPIARTAACLMLSAAFLPNASQAQDAPASSRQLPARGTTSATAAVSRTWADIEATGRTLADRHFIPRAQIPPRPTMDPAQYEAIKAQAARAPRLAKPIRALPPGAPMTIIINKPGPTQAGAGNGYYPPDSNGGISPTQVVDPVNLTFNVYNRNGKLLKTTTFNAFLNTTNSLSDPRVLWDPIWNRWVLSIIDVPASASASPACFWLAASKTANATGAWWIYHACSGGGIFAAGDLWDYDQLGMAQDSLMLTGNIFGYSTGFKGPVIESVAKADIYNGLGFSAPAYAGGTGMNTISPQRVLDNNSTAYFVTTTSTNGIRLIAGSNLQNGSYGGYTLLPEIASPWAVPRAANQPGTSAMLDTLDGRFAAPGTQYGNYLWAVHTESLSGYPSPKFFQIDTNANALVQSGNFYASASSDDWNPSIAGTPNGDAFVTWSSTDTPAGLNAQIRFSGRQAADAVGVIGSGSVLVQSTHHLTGNTQGSVQRWGDYSMTALDPVASTCGAYQRAAIFNEKIVNSSTWGVQYGLIGFCP